MPMRRTKPVSSAANTSMGPEGGSELPEKKIAYYLNFSDVIRVLRLIDEIPFQEMDLELEGLKLRVVQDKKERLPAQHTEAEPSASEPARPAVPEPAREQAVAASVPVTIAERDGTRVLAPLAGTFYRAPSPGAPPFVEVGTS